VTNLCAEDECDLRERVDVGADVWRVSVDEQPQDFFALVVAVDRHCRLIVVLRDKWVTM